MQSRDYIQSLLDNDSYLLIIGHLALACFIGVVSSHVISPPPKREAVAREHVTHALTIMPQAMKHGESDRAITVVCKQRLAHTTTQNNGLGMHMHAPMIH